MRLLAGTGLGQSTFISKRDLIDFVCFAMGLRSMMLKIKKCGTEIDLTRHPLRKSYRLYTGIQRRIIGLRGFLISMLKSHGAPWYTCMDEEEQKRKDVQFYQEADALIRATKDDIMRINWRLPYDVYAERVLEEISGLLR